MEMVALKPSDIVSNGIKIGLANYLSLLGAFVLWGLTIWVPYINVGTTIAIMTLPLALGEGKRISPLEIFDGKYRQFMGEIFVHSGFKFAGLYMGLLFMVVPAIVLQFSWMLSELLIIDKQLNPAEALAESNRRMAGNKWNVFFGELLIGLIIAAAILVLGLLAGALQNSGFGLVILGIVYILVMVFAAASMMGAKAYVYKMLK